MKPSSPDRKMITAVPMIALLAAGTIFHFLFPVYGELAGWVLEDLSVIPYILWVPVGAILGYVMFLVGKSRAQTMKNFSRRMALGLVGWFFLSIIVSLLTETGDIFQRLNSGPLFKGWAVLVFVLLSLFPTMFGTYSVLTRKRWGMGATVSLFFLLAAACMIFSQARSSTILHQDPFLSLMFVFSMVIYVESTSWVKRYIDRRSEFPDGSRGRKLVSSLLRRQISYTIVFTGIASIFAYAPLLLIDLDPVRLPAYLSFYESKTIFGAVVLGIFLMIPLMLLVLVRSRGYINRGQNVEKDGKD